MPHDILKAPTPFSPAESALAPPVKRSGRVHFPNLDGLRTLAWAAVFLQHGFGLLAPKLRTPWTASFTDRLLSAGGIGVSFFFVLSGFLITYLMLDEEEITGRLHVAAFYVRRVLRIWPLYYATIAFAFLAYPLMKRALGYDPYVEAGSVWWYIFFLSNYDVIHLGLAHGAMSTNITWSVAIEEQFYLCWPVLFVLFRPRCLPVALLTIIAGSWIFRYSHAANPMVVYFHTASVISDMAVGGLLAWLVFRSPSFRRRLEDIPQTVIAVVYFVGTLLLVYAYDYHSGPAQTASSRLIFSLLFAFVIGEQCYARHSVVKMQRFDRVTRLGKYTYGLYLLHPIALTLVSSALRVAHITEKSTLGSILTGSAGLVLTLALAWASYRYFEQRFLRLKDLFIR
jgi:peptidoglycan/LPS O-acetylase OafA/YrhL